MKDWRNKVAVVTGGGSGIGEAMAHRFAREGMALIVADIDIEAAGKVAGAIEAGGGVAIAARADVSRQEDLDALAELAWSRFGSADLVCANAGVVPAGRHRPVWEFPLEDWKWAFDVVYVLAERSGGVYDIATQIALWSPLAAALTAVTGIAVLLLFRGMLEAPSS